MMWMKRKMACLSKLPETQVRRERSLAVDGTVRIENQILGALQRKLPRAVRIAKSGVG